MTEVRRVPAGAFVHNKNEEGTYEIFVLQDQIIPIANALIDAWLKNRTTGTFTNQEVK